jgi:hypothetical protein
MDLSSTPSEEPPKGSEDDETPPGSEEEEDHEQEEDDVSYHADIEDEPSTKRRKVSTSNVTGPSSATPVIATPSSPAANVVVAPSSLAANITGPSSSSVAAGTSSSSCCHVKLLEHTKILLSSSPMMMSDWKARACAGRRSKLS